MYGERPGDLWPTHSIEDEQIREVYSRYGLAMYQVQVLEHGVVNATIVLTLFESRASYPTPEDWWDAIDKQFVEKLAKTFGNLLNDLERAAVLPKELMSRLRAAKEPRDILAHRFFRLHVEDFMHASGRQKMIAWCEGQIQMLLELDRELESFYQNTLDAAGINREWLTSRLDEELSRVGAKRDIDPPLW